MIKVFTHENAVKSDPIGQKAVNLIRLQDAGLKVPSWFALSYDGSIFSEDDKSLIEKTIRDLRLSNKSFAVRSSADFEDTEGSSFAGMYETLLNVPESELETSIRKVWTSAQSPRVQEYFKLRNIEGRSGGMSILIQEMVPAEVSGVAFGLNPVNGNPNQVVISSVFGLGEGLVSGALDADRFVVESKKIESYLAQKREGFFMAEISGILKKNIQTKFQSDSSLSERHIRELAAALGLLEEKLGKPQDIEFAIHQNKIWYLQTRPITTLAPRMSPSEDAFTYWDNNNIIESYPGTTTPLTYSFVRKTYQVGYMQMCSLIGIKKQEIEEYRPLFENMIGLLRNRMYYNLNNIHALIGLLPCSNLFRRHFENAIGIDEFRNKDLIEKGFSLKALAGVSYQFLTLPRNRKQFVKELEKVLSEMNAARLEALNADELICLYRDLETRVFGFWKAPVINGLFTMLFFGVLKRITKNWGLTEKCPNIQNDLLVGQKNIVSTEPILRIFELSNWIRSDAGAFHLFSTGDTKTIWQTLERPEFDQLRLKINDYLNRFGERCVGGELKLENPSYRDEPTLFIEILKSYITQEVKFSFDQNKNSAVRELAETKIEEFFKNRKLRGYFFRKVLNQSRQMVIWRENLRFNRTQAFGLVKAIFNEIGKRFESKGLIQNARDIFFLSQEEIFDYESFAAGDIGALVKARKAEFLQNSSLPLTARIITQGNPAHLQITEVPAAQAGSSTILKGTGCSSGVVKGKVRIVRFPEELDHLQGEIMVAESTDPGWVKLFPTASAILLERGSLLSHAGIVTREMGIPCVVGIKGLLAAVKNGDLIEMDGALGVVRILKDAGKE